MVETVMKKGGNNDTEGVIEVVDNSLLSNVKIIRILDLAYSDY